MPRIVLASNNRRMTPARLLGQRSEMPENPA
jgi:hypothetical protein